MTVSGAEVVSETVVCAPNDGAEVAVYELGPMDQWLMDELWIPNALFYENTVDSARLQSSLSQLLALVPVLSGRIGLLPASADGTTKPVIECVNEGVPFIEQTLAKSLEDFGGPAGFVMRDIEPKDVNEYMEAMDPSEVVNNRAPVMRVKLSSLRDGGSILCATFSHIVLDGHSVDWVMRSWSNLYNGKAPLGIPTFHRSAVELPEAIPQPQFTEKALPKMFALMKRYSSQLLDPAAHPHLWPKAVEAAMERRHEREAARFPSGRLNREILTVPKQALIALKTKLQAVAEEVQGADEALRVSTNDVIVALMWHVQSDIRGRPLPGTTAPAEGEQPSYDSLVVSALNVRTKGMAHKDFIGNGVAMGSLMGGPTSYTMSSDPPAPDAAFEDVIPTELYRSAADSQPDEAELLLLAATAQRVRAGVAVLNDTAALQQLLSLLHSNLRYPKELRQASIHALITDATFGCSSWISFKYAEMQFGGPALYLDKFAQAIPWVSCWLWALSGPPALQLHVVVPTEAGAALKGHPLWAQLPGAKWL